MRLPFGRKRLRRKISRLSPKLMSRYILFVEIYRTQDHIEAELIKGILENESINSILKSHVVRYLYPFTVDGLGEVRILVPEDRSEAAKEIIREYKFGTNKRNIYRIK